MRRDTNQLIAFAAFLSAATIALADLERDGALPTGREWAGLAIAFTLISALADAGLPIAGGFAILTLVAILLTRGDEALRWAQARSRGDPPHPQAPQHRPGSTIPGGHPQRGTGAQRA